MIYKPQDFNIPYEFYNLKLFDGEVSDIGWMLNDLTTYYNELLNKFKQTQDKRYLLTLQLIIPKHLGDIKDE